MDFDLDSQVEWNPYLINHCFKELNEELHVLERK